MFFMASNLRVAVRALVEVMPTQSAQTCQIPLRDRSKNDHLKLQIVVEPDLEHLAHGGKSKPGQSYAVALVSVLVEPAGLQIAHLVGAIENWVEPPATLEEWWFETLSEMVGKLIAEIGQLDTSDLVARLRQLDLYKEAGANP